MKNMKTIIKRVSLVVKENCNKDISALLAFSVGTKAGLQLDKPYKKNDIIKSMNEYISEGKVVVTGDKFIHISESPFTSLEEFNN